MNVNYLSNNLKSHTWLLESLNDATLDTNEFIKYINKVTKGEAVTMVEALTNSENAMDKFIADIHVVYGVANRISKNTPELLSAKDRFEKECESYYKILNTITTRLTSIGDN